MADRLIVTKHWTSGAIRVEHYRNGGYVATYNGYPRGHDNYRLYPDKDRRIYGVYYAGKTLNLRDMEIAIENEPAPNATSTPGKAARAAAGEPTEQDYKQISFFDRLYGT